MILIIIINDIVCSRVITILMLNVSLYTATDTTSASGELKIILYIIGIVAAVSGSSSC